MEADIKKLGRICSDIAGVGLDLMEGTIEFSYDNQMSAMKPGHPCEILDSIFQDVYFDVIKKNEPSIEKMETTLEDLKEFREAFSIKELDNPLKEFEDYIKARKESV